MKILENLNLVKAGINFCEAKILPFVIVYAEPKDITVAPPPLFRGRQRKNSTDLSRPNVIVTYYEAQAITGTYQAIFIFVIYAGVALALAINYVVSLVFDALSSLVALQEQVELTTGLILITAFAVFWAGVIVSIKKRMEIWKEFKEDEYEVHKLEYFASKVGSKNIEKTLSKIKSMKIDFKDEAERLKSAKQKRSIQDVEIMKMFNEMMDEREKEIRRKGNIKAATLSVLFWFLGASMTYALEKTYDYWLFGTKPNFSSTNE